MSNKFNTLSIVFNLFRTLHEIESTIEPSPNEQRIFDVQTLYRTLNTQPFSQTGQL